MVCGWNPGLAVGMNYALCVDLDGNGPLPLGPTGMEASCAHGMFAVYFCYRVVLKYAIKWQCPVSTVNAETN